MHTYILALSRLVYHPLKLLDTERSRSWKSPQNICTGLTRAVSPRLVMHPVKCLLHAILVYATTNCIASPCLWSACATSIFTDEDNYPCGVIYQLKTEEKTAIRIQDLTCFPLALLTVPGCAVHCLHTSRI